MTGVGAKYPFKINWNTKQHIGMHLQLDYDKRKVYVRMDGCVEQALK